jgi:hypothetical protein
LVIVFLFDGTIKKANRSTDDVSPSTIVLTFLVQVVVKKFRSHVWMLPLIPY